MDLSLTDLLGLAIATVLAPFLLIPAGALLLAGLERTGFRSGDGWEPTGWAFLLALAVVPAVDGLLVRYGGLGIAVRAHALVLLLSLPFVARLKWRIPWRFVLAALLWWAIVANAYVDYHWGARLFQSITILDLVKHAAVVESIYQGGVPLRDPFFLRETSAGYYFYYYSWAAEIRWLAAPFTDSRMAFAAITFWSGLGVPALLYRVADAAGVIRPGRRRRYFALAIALSFVTGADLPFMLSQSLGQGELESQVDWWNETVSFAMASQLWIPHHLLAVIAAWMGFLLVQRAAGVPLASRWAPAIAAGLAFATTFGSSVWIALTAVPIVIVWWVDAIRRGDLQVPALLVAAGLAALIAALPQLIDLLQGRDDPAFPVSLTIRRFIGMNLHDNAWWAIPQLLLLPLNLGIEFGIFGLGTYLYFRKRRGPIPDGQRLLILSAAVSLLIACFLRSTIINNDLGWRAIWFAQLAAMVWTAAVMQNFSRPFKSDRRFATLAALGVAGCMWDVVGMRLFTPPFLSQVNAAPRTTLSARRAYQWANEQLPGTHVIQHNPERYHRMFNFGLYGIHRTAVADSEANLFGSSRVAVKSRMKRLKPIFWSGLDADAIRKIARREHIDAILWTDRDRAWKFWRGPPPGIQCSYRDGHVCLALVNTTAS